MMERFTPLERAALDYACRLHPDDHAALSEQIKTAKVRSRENTGAGFYTEFEVIGAPPLGGEKRRDAGYTRLVGLKHEVGFIVWLTNGYANCLEAYAVEDTTKIDFAHASFSAFSNPLHDQLGQYSKI